MSDNIDARGGRNFGDQTHRECGREDAGDPKEGWFPAHKIWRLATWRAAVVWLSVLNSPLPPTVKKYRNFESSRGQASAVRQRHSGLPAAGSGTKRQLLS